MQWLAVFLGGGLGSVLRFGVNRLAVNMPLHYPWGTFFANIISSFVLGMIIGLSLQKSQFNPLLKLFFVTGLCGGFSTFSTFSFETFRLLKEGNYLMGGINILTSIVFCLIAIGLGLALGKNL
ncbi:MAG: fluoride efflux transporter CrcB [Bacteroidetes bacterium SW_11_45_7]|nr:MAG: fluoride efflux transporter CrcB [Bacteroidetes bacterium SW_11_45_7]